MNKTIEEYYLSMSAVELRQWLILNVDSDVAMWAPGASELGWTFHVEDGHVFVNSSLGSVYKQRLKTGLPALLPGVEITFLRDPSFR